MGIVELITAVGDEHIELQNIQQNLDSANIVDKGKTGKISFFTAPDKVADLFAQNESKFIGLVLWLPRERVPQT